MNHIHILSNIVVSPETLAFFKTPIFLMFAIWFVFQLLYSLIQSMFLRRRQGPLDAIQPNRPLKINKHVWDGKRAHFAGTSRMSNFVAAHEQATHPDMYIYGDKTTIQ